MIFRTIVWFLRSSRRERLKITDVGTMSMRVTLTDIDTLRHVNNGMYLSFMDLGRVDLMIRSGAWPALSKRGYYPVVASQTISYRKSLQFGQRFDLETKLVGLDTKAVYCEQRFTVDGEIYARGFVKARFLKKAGGTVTVAELTEAVGTDLSELPLPGWIEQWSTDVSLPPTRAAAPSEW